MKLQKYAKYLGVVTLAMGLATACTSTSTTSTTTTSGDVGTMASQNELAVQKTISQAKAALKAAENGGYAWRDTGKFIKEAEKALADGDIATATSLATKALQQSELAKKQSIEQDRAVKELFSKS